MHVAPRQSPSPRFPVRVRILALPAVLALCLAAGSLPAVAAPSSPSGIGDATSWWRADRIPAHRPPPAPAPSTQRGIARSSAPWNDGPFTPSDSPAPGGVPVDQVVVAGDALQAAFRRFADDETRRGVPTVVRTVSWVDTHYAGPDTPARIRAFLRDARDLWGVRYAVLGGDVEHVPTRYVPWDAEEIPTDLYYACLDGEWNEDGDAVWAEPVTAAAYDGLVNDVARTPDGRIWAATHFGIAADDGMHMDSWGRTDGLPADEVLCVDVAPDGAVWVGTTGGVARLDGGAWTAWTTADGLPDERITCLRADRPDAVWVGTGLGVARFDGVQWRTYGVADGLPHAGVMALAGTDASLWIATLGGVAHFDGQVFTSWTSADGLLSSWVYSIGVDPDGTVWAGHPQNFFSHGGISRRVGDLWVPETAPAVTGVTVRDFAFGPAPDERWIATSAGLLRFDGSAYAVESPSTGLPGDVYAVISPGPETVVATASGIARGTAGSWAVRGAADGLPVAPRDYDEADLLGDLLVGRIPATDEAEADRYTAKLASYRRGAGSAHADRVLVTGENLFSPGDGKVFGQAAAARFPAAYARTRLYEIDGTESRASVIAALNAGAGWVVQVSHGSYDVLGVGAPSELLFNRDLDNTSPPGGPGFFLVYSCNSGGFDFESSAEHLLFHPTAGAIATVSNTREAVPEVDALANESMLDGVFGASGGRALDALEAARAARWHEDPDALRTATWTRRMFLSHSYLGAPDLPLWRAPARALVVACPAEVPLARAQYDVQVSDAQTGVPVAGATVCVSKGAEDWARGVTDASGQVRFRIRPLSAGTVTVVAGADGYALQEAASTVLPAGGPVVRADGAEVLAVRAVSTGHELDVRLAVRNAGLDAGGGWSVELVSGEEAVHVIQGSAAIPPLGAGETAWAGPFVLRVHPSFGSGTPFTVQLRGAGPSAFLESYRLEMGGPLLRVRGVRVYGEIVEPLLENAGTEPSGPLQVDVVPLDADGVVLEGHAGLASLAPGESRRLEDGLRVTGSPAAEFELRVRDARGRTLSRRFDRIAPAAPVGATHEPRDGGAHLEWTPSPAPDLAGYRVLRHDGGSWTDLSPRFLVTAASYEVDLPAGGLADFAILAEDTGGAESADTCFVTAHAAPPLLPGWPRRLSSLVGPSPTMVSDLDGDGVREVLVGSMWEANCVNVFRADGTEWTDGDGRNSTWGPFGTTGGRVHAAPLAVDVDGDGRKEVFTVSFDGKAYGWRTDGSVPGAPQALPGWPVLLSPQGARSAPVAADVDGDGTPEIVTVALDGWVRVLEPGGGMSAGWPRAMRASGAGTTPAIHDLDGDGRDDLVFGGADSLLYAVSGTGSDLPGWPVPLGAKVLSCPVLADIDGDGVPEIFAMARDGRTWGFRAGDEDGVPGADPLPGWPVALDPYPNTPPSPAVADFDADGVPEIVVPGGDKLWILRADGTAFPGWPLALEGGVVNSPVVADLDGDGSLDVLIGTDHRRLHALRIDGSSLPGWPRAFHENPWSTPYVADVDGDGDLDVAVTSDDLEVRIVDVAGPDLPGSAPWPGYHGGESLRGVWVPAGAPPAAPVALSAAGGPAATAALEWMPAAPNPFREATRLGFALPAPGPVRLDVFDVTGRRVATLVDGRLPAGRHGAAWDGRDAAGRTVAGGVYFLRLTAAGETRAARVIRLR